MIALGVVGIAVGATVGPWPLVPGGFVLLVIFGYIAAGSSGVDVSFGPFKGKAPLPRRTKRRKVVRRSGFPKHGQSPAEPKAPPDASPED